MSTPRKPDAEMLALSREEAVEYFAGREADIKDRIRGLSTPDKLRLAAEFFEAGLPPNLTRNVARLALEELELLAGVSK